MPVLGLQSIVPKLVFTKMSSRKTSHPWLPHRSLWVVLVFDTVLSHGPNRSAYFGIHVEWVRPSTATAGAQGTDSCRALGFPPASPSVAVHEQSFAGPWLRWSWRGVCLGFPAFLSNQSPAGEAFSFLTEVTVHPTMQCALDCTMSGGEHVSVAPRWGSVSAAWGSAVCLSVPGVYWRCNSLEYLQ